MNKIDELKEILDKQNLTQEDYKEMLMYVDKRIAELEGRLQ